MKAIVLVLVGGILGALFVNDKLPTTNAVEKKTEIVYGTRIDSNGNFMLVTAK